jgi:hypothetical protein
MFVLNSPSRFVLLLLLVAMVGFCQVDRSSLNGEVLDQSGRTIPNVVVLAKNEKTGTERNTKSNAKGTYALTDLPIGNWTVVFSAAGFRNTRYQNVEQTVGQIRTLNPVLELAVKGDELTVTETLTRLNQSSSTLSEAVEQKAISDLPLNGRNWTSLTALTPGAIDQGGSTQRSIRFTGRGRDEMNITLDGVDATGIVNQAQKAFVRLAIPMSAIAEFRVDAVLPTAEYGDASGAQISVASASGGNRFSGSLFEYFRNSDFDARSPLDLTKGPLPFHLNQFGGNFGGPITKDRTFFFVDFEQIQQVQDQTLIGFVPSAALRAQILLKSPVLAPIVNAYSLGTGSISATGIQQRTGVTGSTDTEYSETIRLDHHFNATTTAYARFGYDNAAAIAPLGNLTDRQLSAERPLNGAAELLHVFSPTLLNEFKFGINEMVSHTYNLSAFPYTVNVSGFTALNPSQTTNQDGRTFGWLDNVSLTRGRNVIRAGIEIRRIEINEGNSFTGSLTYNSLANFMANNLDSAAYTATLPLKRMRKTSYFGYLQDEFKLRPNLTVNAGLRYEFYNAFHEVSGRAIPFDFGTCGGFCAPNAPFLFPAKDNIDPRVGLAWSPTGTNGRLVVRAGYGIYHEDAQLDDQNFPTANDVPRYTLARGAQFPTLSYPFDSLLAGATGVLSPKDQVRNRKDTYAQQWIFSLQQALPGHFTGTVSYTGNKGTDIMNRSYVNLLDPVTRLRPYPQFGQIELRAKDSNSEFNALQVSVRRYLARGWLMTANYMWSHAINDGSLGSGVEDIFPENVSCRACDRASSDQDARHSFSVSNVYQLPFGAGRTFLQAPGLLHTLLGGWEVNGIVGGRTGLPVNITVDRAAAVMPDGNSGNQRPNYVAGSLLAPSGGSTPLLWINPAAFSVPAAGTWGNLGRNAFRGPGLWQVDAAIQRRFVLRERVAFELRGECFNLLNRAQYANPLADISVPSTFGRITSVVNTAPTGSGTPRQFEVAARLVF